MVVKLSCLGWPLDALVHALLLARSQMVGLSDCAHMPQFVANQLVTQAAVH